jgi:glycosyltransferase involved in cell wall biosynthesis
MHAITSLSESGPSVLKSIRIAVLVPCYNEAQTIREVVDVFRRSLPDVVICVFDNNSTDGTGDVARQAGARVVHVGLQGKGNVVRRMFADVEADVYVMVDGDATYDASAAPLMVKALIEGGLDMVVGSRVSTEQAAYRAGHRWGNRMLTGFAAALFGRAFEDMLSGYRVFSRRFVKSFAAHARGFETETELAVHALELRMPVREMPTAYGARPEGSSSKLSTYRDGWRILMTIVRLFKDEKPLLFYGAGFVACLVASLAFAVPVIDTYIQTGLVPRLPTAVLSASLALLAVLFLVCGLILETVTLGRQEAKRLAYLREPAPGPSGSQGAL